MSLYVAAYDITRPARRARVAEILLEYGRRVQRSVFEIEVEPEELDELRFRIGLLLAASDAFDLFPIDTRRPEARISWQRKPRTEEVVFFGPYPGAEVDSALADSAQDGSSSGESPNG